MLSSSTTANAAARSIAKSDGRARPRIDRSMAASLRLTLASNRSRWATGRTLLFAGVQSPTESDEPRLSRFLDVRFLGGGFNKLLVLPRIVGILKGLRHRRQFRNCFFVVK